MNNAHVLRTLESVVSQITKLENGDYLIPKEGKDGVEDLIVMTGIMREEQELYETEFEQMMTEFEQTQLKAYRHENNLF